MKLRRGDIWLVDLEPVRTRELGKTRPCLIISDVAYNNSAPAAAGDADHELSPNDPFPRRSRHTLKRFDRRLIHPPPAHLRSCQKPIREASESSTCSSR